MADEVFCAMTGAVSATASAMESCEIRMRFDEFMMMRPVVRLGSRSVPPEKGKAQLNYDENFTT